MKLFRKKYRGAALLETVLTLPIICCLIFFILELMKMNDTQTSIDSMATEMSLDFMASKNTDHFNGIITKYKPPFIATANVSWYFVVYRDLATMNSASQFGGEEVFWPTVTTNNNIKTVLSHGAQNSEYIDSKIDNTFMSASGGLTISNYMKPELSFALSKTDADLKTLSGKAFVLTVVCDYQFSSSFVRKFFAGGTNTKGTKFLVWGKSVGVCN